MNAIDKLTAADTICLFMLVAIALEHWWSAVALLGLAILMASVKKDIK